MPQHKRELVEKKLIWHKKSNVMATRSRLTPVFLSSELFFETELTKRKRIRQNHHRFDRLILARERICSDQSSGRIRASVAVVVVTTWNSDLDDPSPVWRMNQLVATFPLPLFFVLKFRTTPFCQDSGSTCRWKDTVGSSTTKTRDLIIRPIGKTCTTYTANFTALPFLFSNI